LIHVDTIKEITRYKNETNPRSYSLQKYYYDQHRLSTFDS